jgi:uncharacterized protein YndB with AHSA1/START domain
MRRAASLLLAAAVLLPSLLPAVAAERVIGKEIVIAAGVDEIWDAWTTRDGIVGFFAPDARIEAKPDGAFAIHFDPTAPDGLKGADDMRFLALQPKKMLSFTWNAPPHLPQARAQRTVVIVRFETIGERHTRVSLHHTGWGDGGEWDQAYAYFERAWGFVLGNLKKRFDEGPIDWSGWMAQLRQAREQAAQKK